MVRKQQKKIQTFVESMALFIVVIVPAFAIGWYLLGGNDATTADTESVQVPTVTPSTTVSQQASPPAVATGTITLQDPLSLPQYVAAAQIAPFSLLVENTGAVAHTFTYKVSVVWNSGEKDVIDENSVMLSAGASVTLPESLKFETASARATVYAQLLPSGPSIDFAMPRA